MQWKLGNEYGTTWERSNGMALRLWGCRIESAVEGACHRFEELHVPTNRQPAGSDRREHEQSDANETRLPTSVSAG